MFEHAPSGVSTTLPGLSLGDAPSFRPEASPGGRTADHHLLFFALLPPSAVALRACAAAGELRRIHHLREPAVASDKLHITLQPVVAFEKAMPDLIIRAAVDAAAGLAAACRPVDLSFDQAGSMGIRAPTALALRCHADTECAIAALRGPLVHALRRHGFELQQHRSPHMTLVYGTELLARQAIEPIRWTATRLSLVLSHHGCAHHEHIGSWPLLGH